MNELLDQLPVEPFNLLICLLVYGGVELLKWLFREGWSQRNSQPSVQASATNADIHATLYKLAVVEENRDKQMDRITEILTALQVNMTLQTSNLSELRALALDSNNQIREVKNRVITLRERK